MDQKRYYNNRSSMFDNGLLIKRNNRNHEKKIEMICKLLSIDRNSQENKLLEVGTGSGIHASYLARKWPNLSYTGVDISGGMISEASKKLDSPHATLIVADGQKLPFKDSSFDAAFISGSLHHFNDPYSGLREILRVIKEGGKIVVMEPNLYFPINFFYALFNAYEHGITNMRYSCFLKWSHDLGLTNITIGNLLYTPPVPRALSYTYDVIDRIAMEIPLVSRISIMLYMSGVKSKNYDRYQAERWNGVL